MGTCITNLLKTNSMSNERKFEIRSDEVNDILTKIPGWMVRSGSMVILGILLLLIIGASFFKYPDIITAPVVVTSQNLPAQIISKKAGRITTIIPANGAVVKKGDVIAILENPADFSDYIEVKEICNEYPNIKKDLPENLQLGEMQQAYSLFVKSYREYLSFISLDYHGKMVRSVKKEIVTKEEQLNISLKREQIAKEQYRISQELYNREKALFEQKAISRQDFDKAYSASLLAAQQLEGAKEECNSARADLIKTNQTILNLELAREEGFSNLKRVMEANHSILTSQLGEWEQTNLFIAPVNGLVSFTSFWQENQNVLAGEIVFTILPNNEKKIAGKVYLPMNGAGKVKLGQKVNIKLDSYPYMEYGMVECSVTAISLLPASLGEHRAYIVEVDFPNGLKTTYNIELNFGEEMHGIAQIITEEASLLRRIFYPLNHLIKTYF